MRARLPHLAVILSLSLSAALALPGTSALAQGAKSTAGSSGTSQAPSEQALPDAPPASVTGPAPSTPPAQPKAQDQNTGKSQDTGKAVGAEPAPDQGVLGLSGGKNGEPVAVEAEQGIEWQQQKQLYIARGNAKAKRGDVTVYGDILQAYYRKTDTGGSDVWRLEANGAVKITTATDTAVGDRAVYDVDNAIFVLTGQKPELDTPKARITARDSLEYWQHRQYAVARGDATAIQEDKSVRANVMEAHFKPDAKGNLQMSNIEAFGNVVITSPNATARALYGDYNLDSGIAILKGQVKITRGQDQLNGECAEVNTNTGISRLFTCAKEDRVRGLLVPKPPDDNGTGQDSSSSGAASGGKPASKPSASKDN
ncbi:MAG TPA: LptA/OstA family protein [Alphaproteobacteria bacterium]|nr:LptA/OstA family protein [Alphaproteobacteria bacterium]